MQGAAKANFAATIGSAMEEEVSPGLITVGLKNDPSQMQVHTFDPEWTPAARPSILRAFEINKSCSVGATIDVQSMIPTPEVTRV